METMSNTSEQLCHIGLKSVAENLLALQRSLPTLEFFFQKACASAAAESFTEAHSDIAVIKGLFKKLALKIPELLSLCHSNNIDEEFWKEARHDLRANVGAIKSYAELISEDFIDKAPKPFIDNLHDLINQVTKTLPLIAKITPQSGLDETSANQTVVKLRPQLVAKVLGRILIIDDDPQKRNILRRHLEGLGHEIDESPDGKSGLIKAEETPVDLILLDILMPEMSGHEVLEILKQNQQTKNIPVLVVSSLSELDSVVRCIDAGADDYLDMPVDPVLLNARVNACLEKKMAADREKEQSIELQTARDTLYAAMESIEDGFAIFDACEYLVMKNETFSEMYPAIKVLDQKGFSYTDFLKKNIELNRYLSLRRSDENYSTEKNYTESEWLDEAITHFRTGKKPQEVHFSDGRWIEVTNAPIPSGGTVSLHKDITERKRREREVQRRADFDGLTGLANRSYFDRLLKEAFEQTSKGQAPFALMFFDLDGFKKVNDDFGHDFGDLVLTNVADKLRTALRETDLVARLGGDEFCAILYNIHDTDFPKIAATRCLESVGTFVERDGVRANFGTSIGIAIFPGDANTPEELLSNADAAMYDAKKSGKGTYRLFSDL